MVELEIDGKRVSVPEGTSIIEAADQAGIYIPRFCYHRKLSIAANCRMCLVEVEKVGKPLPACATPVTPDMKVFTASQKALEAQRAVMQFLLVNHPLDCPICDQGGQCELQDLAMGYGSPYSYYNQGKRSVYSHDIGHLIETEMTRCIQCTRCVRFGEEIAGLRELGCIGRGEELEIGTYVKHFMQSELSGNIADICPVGALTEKPSRYQGRAWEVQEHHSIAPHDCVGSNIYIHTRSHQYKPQKTVLKVVPRDNEAINENWLSDRDRFAYEGVNHQQRILKPMMKKNGQWVEVDWKRALLEVADRMKAIAEQQGGDKLAALMSANATTEECYLTQKLMRSLGSNNIDHRLREHDFSDQRSVPACPDMGMKIADITDLDVVLLIGSHLRYEQPILNHHVFQGYQDGTEVSAINPVDYPFNYALQHKIIDANIVTRLAEVVKALAERNDKPIPELNNITVSEQAMAIADQLQRADNKAVFLGAFAMHHPQAAHIRSLVRLIAELTGAKIGTLTDGANGCGAWLAGAVPHRCAAGQESETGLNAKQLFTSDPVRGYLLLGVEPEFDSAYSAAALKALQKAGLVVCLSPFVTETMQGYADFILPVAPFSETVGTFVNAEGTWQRFPAASVPKGDAKPAWKVLRALANFLELPGFDYMAANEVLQELKEQTDVMPERQHALGSVSLNATKPALMRIGAWPMYRVDNIVRRAHALQLVTSDMHITNIRINQNTADSLQLNDGDYVKATQGEGSVSLPLIIDNRIADGLVVLPSGLNETAGFGDTMAEITLQKEAHA